MTQTSKNRQENQEQRELHQPRWSAKSTVMIVACMAMVTLFIYPSLQKLIQENLYSNKQKVLKKKKTPIITKKMQIVNVQDTQRPPQKKSIFTKKTQKIQFDKIPKRLHSVKAMQEWIRKQPWGVDHNTIKDVIEVSLAHLSLYQGGLSVYPWFQFHNATIRDGLINKAYLLHDKHTYEILNKKNIELKAKTIQYLETIKRKTKNDIKHSLLVGFQSPELMIVTYVSLRNFIIHTIHKYRLMTKVNKMIKVISPFMTGKLSIKTYTAFRLLFNIELEKIKTIRNNRKRYFARILSMLKKMFIHKAKTITETEYNIAKWIWRRWDDNNPSSWKYKSNTVGPVFQTMSCIVKDLEYLLTYKKLPKTLPPFKCVKSDHFVMLGEKIRIQKFKKQATSQPSKQKNGTTL